METRSSRGFTLVEMMLVIVLAGVVTLGLLGFYLNSQATWMDASSQAMAQRDATNILEAIAARAREADQVTITPNGADSILTFLKIGGSEPYSFWWNRTGDGLVHQGPGIGMIGDNGPVVPTIVDRFSFEMDPALPILHLRMLEVRSSQGERVQLSSSFSLYNAPRPR